MGTAEGNLARIRQFKPMRAGVVSGTPAMEVVGPAINRIVRDVVAIFDAGGHTLERGEVLPW